MFSAIGKVIEAIIELIGAIADLLASVAESIFEFVAWPFRYIARFLRWLAAQIRTVAKIIRRWFISGRELSRWANVMGWIIAVVLCIACGTLPFIFDVNYPSLLSFLRPTATVTSFPSSTPLKTPSETIPSVLFTVVPSATISPTIQLIPTITQTNFPTVTSTNDNSVLSPCNEIGQERISPTDGMSMVCIPTGEFILSDGSRGTLDSFWIDKIEVTNAMFAAFITEQGINDKDGWRRLYYPHSEIPYHDGESWIPNVGYENHPVTGVTQYGAREYCEWVGRRLPTKNEWEKASLGVNGSLYPWGDEFNCSLGNFDDRYEGCDGFERTAPVGSFPEGVSPYGALDLVGNVWEWMFETTSNSRYANGFIRGGGHSGYSWAKQSSKIVRISSWGTGENIGFRCAMTDSQ